MKEKLIQIFTSGERDRFTTLYDAINNLRCDKCTHWTATGWTSGAMYCAKLERTTELTCISGEYGYDVTAITKPDFFCALWEAK